MKLTSENVSNTFKHCLWSEEEIKELGGENQAIEKSTCVTGISANYAFNSERLASSKNDIKLMLEQLPCVFADGMSFLNACDNKDGEMWTGSQKVMEEIFVLGMAAGFVKECFSRDMWPMLPGGVPYYIVDTGGGGAKIGDTGYTRDDLTDMIAKMNDVTKSFYAAATQTGCHGFIEFCGLMGEYVKMCEFSLENGIDFATANTHNERPLAAAPHQIAYIVEKLDCIFGPAIRSNPETKAAFASLVNDEDSNHA